MRDAALYDRKNVFWEGDIGLPLPYAEMRI